MNKTRQKMVYLSSTKTQTTLTTAYISTHFFLPFSVPLSTLKETMQFWWKKKNHFHHIVLIAFFKTINDYFVEHRNQETTLAENFYSYKCVKYVYMFIG